MRHLYPELLIAAVVLAVLITLTACTTFRSPLTQFKRDGTYQCHHRRDYFERCLSVH